MGVLGSWRREAGQKSPVSDFEIAMSLRGGELIGMERAYGLVVGRGMARLIARCVSENNRSPKPSSRGSRKERD